MHQCWLEHDRFLIRSQLLLTSSLPRLLSPKYTVKFGPNRTSVISLAISGLGYSIYTGICTLNRCVSGISVLRHGGSRRIIIWKTSPLGPFAHGCWVYLHRLSQLIPTSVIGTATYIVLYNALWLNTNGIHYEKKLSCRWTCSWDQCVFEIILI